MIYKYIIFLLLCLIPAEFSHRIALFFIEHFWFIVRYIFGIKVLKHQNNRFFLGQNITNCVGVAAGFDKNGVAINGLFKLGFGFVEIGTVTLKSQVGNQKPRIFRLVNHKSIINSMGFPNDGSDKILSRLQNFNRKYKKNNQIVGVNIGMNKDGDIMDYEILLEKFYQYCDYITINISSPNTPKLRDFLLPQNIDNFLQRISTKKVQLMSQIPIFLKISPDLSTIELRAIYKAIVRNSIDGVIISNTTIDRPDNIGNHLTGGLSGALLRAKSQSILSAFAKLNVDNKILVIASGGISSKEDIIKIIESSEASVVQIYTSFVYQC